MYIKLIIKATMLLSILTCSGQLVGRISKYQLVIKPIPLKPSNPLVLEIVYRILLGHMKAHRMGISFVLLPLASLSPRGEVEENMYSIRPALSPCS